MDSESPSLGVKLPQPETDLPTSSAQVKNDWRCNSAFRIHPHVMYKDKFILHF
jgi:hypothetical protein